MATALSTLRQQVARLLGAGDAAMFTGTPAATFSTTGFTCAALGPYETSYFVDWWLRFYSGTHKDTTKIVTAFTTSTGAFVFTSALGSAVDATDLFEVHRDYAPEELNDAINLAIRMVQDEFLEDKIDETLVVAASTWEYAIPTAFYTLQNVYQEESIANQYSFSKGNAGLLDAEKQWRIVGNQGSRKLWFDPHYSVLVTDRNLRLEGQAQPSTLTLDADTTNVPAAYLINQAASILHLSRSGEVTKAHTQQAKMFQDLADRERAKLRVNPFGWRV